MFVRILLFLSYGQNADGGFQRFKATVRSTIILPFLE